MFNTTISCRNVNKEDSRSDILNDNRDESIMDIEDVFTTDIEHQSTVDIQQSTSDIQHDNIILAEPTLMQKNNTRRKT